jgi:hypothetical protein
MAKLNIPDDEQTAALIYMQRCLALLRMWDWDIILSEEAADDANNGEVNAYDNRRYVATLFLPNDWPEKPMGVKQSTILHECLHIAHVQPEHAVRELEHQSAMSKDVYDLVMSRFIDGMEYMVDKLTRVFTEQDMLPPWPTKAEIAKADLKSTIKGGTL